MVHAHSFFVRQEVFDRGSAITLSIHRVHEIILPKHFTICLLPKLATNSPLQNGDPPYHIFSSKITLSYFLLQKVVTQSLTSSMHSSQKISFKNSKIFFSKNCSQENKKFILSSFQMTEGKSYGKYLGFPIFLARPKK